MAIVNTSSLPLYERISHRNPLKNAVEIIIFFLLLSLLLYRLLFLMKNHDFTWVLAFFCELWFTFYWLIITVTKWNPVEFKTYPDRLLQRVGEREIDELPSVDMFVTTADPALEPPIMTINTVISLLAIDYPAHKLACYVSDDGCSPLILYSLMEASKFAKLWVPFCKKYNVQVRAPFRYFSDSNCNSTAARSSDSDNKSGEFLQLWKAMKDEYEQLCRKIEDAADQKSSPYHYSSGDFAVFSNIERTNHPTIIKSIWENKQGLSGLLPHLIYISREKRQEHPHHYKAGAMNVLTRVSGVMTNAPYMLNVDCDMFGNNPKLALLAMCLFLNPNSQKEVAFVQFPQVFYDGLKDDPFGNQLVVTFKHVGRGLAGLQGFLYGGTGCFHRRTVIYGACPDDNEAPRTICSTNINGKLTNKELLQTFGDSKDFIETASDALNGQASHSSEKTSICESIEAAYQVAGCSYEYGSRWGSKVGWMYGSTTEDILTGLNIHKRGWRSILCMPDPPAFLGCAPIGGPSSLTQRKRWATGLLEILLSYNCPIFHTLFANLQFTQCCGYISILSWGICCIPELCYAALSAYCLITNSHFLPKLEYLGANQSIRAWWNNQRMGRIISSSAWVFGVLGVVLKLLGISETVFEVTQKDQSDGNDDNGDAGRFTFDESPVFVPVTALLLVQLTALAMGLIGLRSPRQARDGEGSGPLEVVCSVWLVLSFWPFLKGMFRKGKYGFLKDSNLPNMLKIQIQIQMISAEQVATVYADLAKDISVVEFNPYGSLTFVSHIDGHFIWDVDSSKCHPYCDCDWEDDSDDKCYSSRRKKKKTEKSQCKPQISPRRPPTNPSTPLPIYRKALKILEKEISARTAQLCMMFASDSQQYTVQFPLLGRQDHPDLITSSKPYIQQKEVMPNGSRKSITQEAKVLNWHSLNSQALN
ncbi:hypothetical protein FNV43_RR13125 [Rhamnella rubrinervis]|uniref:Cellulose synthase-like protein H1 n=1 Tax=Rhamnella rubrinervis TaxID=2594499 RepID=A0A8K0H0M9_9ROSA|nr:hypothetical protein FNV43_RR13125 [Rhamnella rubrinervis]